MLCWVSGVLTLLGTSELFVTGQLCSLSNWASEEASASLCLHGILL